MTFPTMEQVEKADREQICRWHRFLHGVGITEMEVPIMDRIAERFRELGGFTPEISEGIGWTE
jgi:hypothetical protein